MTRSRMIVSGLVVSSAVAVSQGSVTGVNEPDIKLTGNLRVDLFGRTNIAVSPQLSTQEGGVMDVPRKSPWLAAGLSLAIPGAGELYAESYIKAAAFFAAEVAAWAFAYSYDKKGDRQTDLFENYADMHWSVVDYAQYADDNLAPAGETYDWLIPGTEGRPPWERVRWDELNRMERSISEFSHTLPLHGEQQYYELIGKYYQFNQGWQDVALIPGTPGQLNTYYEKERARADDFYGVASTAVNIAIINHVLSAADAAWSASTYNKVHAQVGMQTIPLGRDVARVPVLKMSYSF